MSIRKLSSNSVCPTIPDSRAPEPFCFAFADAHSIGIECEFPENKNEYMTVHSSFLGQGGKAEVQMAQCLIAVRKGRGEGDLLAKLGKGLMKSQDRVGAGLGQQH